MTAGKIVLLQMAAGPYPEETRMLGAWALRCMLRLLHLPEPCVLICDEFARLGVQGRAALDLLSLGREFGKPVILSTQGPSDFGELGHHALDQAAQDAAWVLAFRQGTRDSTTASRLLGVRWGQERSWSTGSSDTRENVASSSSRTCRPRHSRTWSRARRICGYPAWVAERAWSMSGWRFHHW
jgi:hypothetical protein